MRAHVYCQAAGTPVVVMIKQAAGGLRLGGDDSPAAILFAQETQALQDTIIVLHADSEAAQTLRSRMRGEREADSFIKLLKHHYLIVVVPDDVRGELGSELARLDQGVDVAVVSYDQRSPLDSLAKIVEALASAKATLLADPGRYIRKTLEADPSRLGYEIESQHKTVTVYPNGHGIIEFATEISVTSNLFEGPVHYFGLNDNVPREVRMPSLADLARTDSAFRGLKPMFDYRVLAPKARLSSGSLVAEEIPAESTDRMRVVRFRFSPRPRPDETLKYAWEWAFPNLFLTVGEDTSGFRCIREFWDFSIEVRFVHPGFGAHTAFAEGGDPTLHILGLGDELAVLPARGIDEVEYRSYRWALTKGIAGNQYIVRWNLAAAVRTPRASAIPDASQQVADCA